MKTQKIEKGDTVQLKSGGPFMTVISDEFQSDGKSFVRCAWFDEAKKLESSFIVESLDIDD